MSTCINYCTEVPKSIKEIPPLYRNELGKINLGYFSRPIINVIMKGDVLTFFPFDVFRGK